MTAIVNVVTFRDSTQGGKRMTGLAPVFSTFALLSSGAAVANPAITEVGHGAYKFTYDPAANGEVIWQADGGATLSQESDRYVDGTCTYALQVQPGDVTAIAEAVPSEAQIATAVQTGLTAQGYTAARAPNLDDLNESIAAAVAAIEAAIEAAGDGSSGPTASDIEAAVLDQANGVEVGVTVRQALRQIAAAAAGARSGVGTGTIVVDGINTDTTRMTATIDTSGNISAVNLNLG